MHVGEQARECVAAGMRKGLVKKVKIWAGKKGACTLVNKTGEPLVVRAKYKDVWEGQPWRLAAEGGQMVVPSGLLKSAQPYCRLGVSLEGAGGHVLFINSRHVLASPRIIVSLSPSPSRSLCVNEL